MTSQTENKHGKGACCGLSTFGRKETTTTTGFTVPRAVATAHGEITATFVDFPPSRSFVGTDKPYHKTDGESPRRNIRLRGFSCETFPVTNLRFKSFVEATGYVTEAERFGWAPVFVFPQLAIATREIAHPDSFHWQRVAGACWHAPEGPGSDLAERLDHPVVQVSWADATAFAHWSGGRLPAEAEWEHAARGGLTDPKFPWGDEEPDDEAVHCNIWQGQFPEENTARDGYLTTNPAGAFKPNAAGLYDMAGNVWEWTADPFRSRSASVAAKRHKMALGSTPSRVVKGGSFLCHNAYCYRYRIAARMPLEARTCANNVGFRLFR